MLRQPGKKTNDTFSSFIILALAVFLISGHYSYAEAANSPEERRILILDSFHQDLPLSKLFLKGLQERFEQRDSLKIHYFYEYMDRQRYSLSSSYIKHLPEYLKEKYSSQKIDLIIAHRRLAFDFMVKYGADIFKDVPVISVGDERESYSAKDAPSNFTQVIGSVDIGECLRILMQTRPQTKDIYVIIDKTALAVRVKEKLSKELGQFEGIVRIHFYDELAFPELLDKVSAITGDAAIFYIFIFKDAAGADFVPREALSEIVRQAKVPVYGIDKTFLGTGIVGGNLSSGDMLGARVADIGFEILTGTHNIGDRFEIFPAEEYVFDWRTLKRWGIDETGLPPGSRVEFRQLGLWELYRGYVVGALFLLALQTTFIVILVMNRRKRKKVERELAALNAELESRVQERTLALTMTNQQLQHANLQQDETNRVLIGLNEKLELISRTDLLTDLFNRRHVAEKIEQEFERFQRTGHKFSLIIADIDSFKQINDNYGHAGGDFALKGVADEMRKSVRPYDVVGRWGGEEFLCLLPETELHSAAAVAERMRSGIQEKVFFWEEAVIATSMTLGVSMIRETDTVDELITRADKALYQGKQSGKNRVTIIA